MGIDIRSEELVRLNDVRRLKNLPPGRDGKRLHISTLFRWTLRGLKGVRLETIKIGGTTCTSIEALQRFFDELTRRSSGGASLPTSSPPQWSAKRLREIEAASRKLDEILGPIDRKAARRI